MGEEGEAVQAISTFAVSGSADLPGGWMITFKMTSL